MGKLWKHGRAEESLENKPLALGLYSHVISDDSRDVDGTPWYSRVDG